MDHKDITRRAALAAGLVSVAGAALAPVTGHSPDSPTAASSALRVQWYDLPAVQADSFLAWLHGECLPRLKALNYVGVIDLKTLTLAGRIESGPGPDGLAWAVLK